MSKKKDVQSKEFMAQNPFEIFDLELRFALNLRTLDRRYFEMQKKAHPDQVDGQEHFSSALNGAYHTLKNPVKRAAALLDVLGLPIPGSSEEDASLTAGIVLLEIFDFQEAILALENAEEALEMNAELEEMFAQEQYIFSDAFDQGNSEVLIESYVKLCYIDRLMKQMFEAEQQFFPKRHMMH